jgi:hypothetical protein
VAHRGNSYTSNIFDADLSVSVAWGCKGQGHKLGIRHGISLIH